MLSYLAEAAKTWRKKNAALILTRRDRDYLRSPMRCGGRSGWAVSTASPLKREIGRGAAGVLAAAVPEMPLHWSDVERVCADAVRLALALDRPTIAFTWRSGIALAPRW